MCWRQLAHSRSPGHAHFLHIFCPSYCCENNIAPCCLQDGTTPIFLAAEKGHAEMVEVLFMHGASHRVRAAILCCTVNTIHLGRIAGGWATFSGCQICLSRISHQYHSGVVAQVSIVCQKCRCAVLLMRLPKLQLRPSCTVDAYAPSLHVAQQCLCRDPTPPA